MNFHSMYIVHTYGLLDIENYLQQIEYLVLELAKDFLVSELA